MSRRRRGASREAEVDPFYDMLFNMLIAFVFCFIVALLAMNPRALKAGDIPSKAEYIVNVGWPDRNPNDIDTWVQDPGGNLEPYPEQPGGAHGLDGDGMKEWLLFQPQRWTWTDADVDEEAEDETEEAPAGKKKKKPENIPFVSAGAHRRVNFEAAYGMLCLECCSRMS